MLTPRILISGMKFKENLITSRKIPIAKMIEATMAKKKTNLNKFSTVFELINLIYRLSY